MKRTVVRTGVAGIVALLVAAGIGAEEAQLVEGFAASIQPPAPSGRPGSVPLDFRGPVAGYMTDAWWTRASGKRLKWRTAVVPRRQATVFAFVGASSVVPAEFARGPRARLYLDGRPVVTFDIGQARDREWRAGDVALRYEARRAEWPWSAAQRQFNLNGDSGIYRLSVPASAVRAGVASVLEVELLPFPAWPNGWFMVKERRDTLVESPRAMAEEIRQLQRDVTRLGELTQVLAGNQYAKLLDSRQIEHGIIHTDGWRHLHPADLIRLRSGELLVTAREATEHIARDGDVIMLRSRDGGRTWGERQVIAATRDLDEREGCGLELSDGTLLVAVFYNAMYRDDGEYEWEWQRKLPFGQGKRWMGTYVITSRDAGRTWSAPRYIDTRGMPFTDTEGPADAPLELPDGRILMPVMGYNVRGDMHNEAAVILESADRGATWRYLSTMAEDPGGKLGFFQEPAITRTRSGRIVAAIRNQGPDNAIWTTYSDDDGRTWIPVCRSPMIGHPADLVQLADGRVLCTYGVRSGRHADPAGIRASWSEDNGETWRVEREVQIRRDFLNIDIGYPESIQLADGQVLTVYYFNLFGRFFLGWSRWTP